MTQDKLKILVVNDEEGLLDLHQRILRFKFGCETLGTIDGTEAVKIFREHKPEICLLDVQLDKSLLSGIDVLREVRKITPQVKCIMISRDDQEVTIKQAKKLGAYSYLLKPVEKELWLGVVKEAIDLVLKEKQ